MCRAVGGSLVSVLSRLVQQLGQLGIQVVCLPGVAGNEAQRVVQIGCLGQSVGVLPDSLKLSGYI